MVDTIYHSANLRQRRYYGSDTFFVSKCIQPRKPLLLPEQREIISEALLFYVKQGKIILAAFVVMPDHWHALLAPVGGKTLSQTIAGIQMWVSNNTHDYLEKHDAEWQTGFYETRVRSSKQFSYVYNYIENNPVVKKLANAKEEWNDSSANIKYIDKMQRPWPWRFEYD